MRFDPATLELEARSERIAPFFHDAAIDPSTGTVWIFAVHSVFRVDIA